MLKIGFREEGFARRYLRIDGDWRDHVLFGMLASDPRPVSAPLPASVERRPPARATSGAFAPASRSQLKTGRG